MLWLINKESEKEMINHLNKNSCMLWKTAVALLYGCTSENEELRRKTVCSVSCGKETFINQSSHILLKNVKNASKPIKKKGEGEREIKDDVLVIRESKQIYSFETKLFKLLW